MIKPDQIIRSNRKTLSVSIDHFGRVTVRAPKRYGDERIFSFLKEKEAWITRHVEQKKGAGMALPSENLDNFSFLLLGEPCLISLIDEKNIRLQNSENGGERVLFLPKDKPRQRLVKWLKEDAQRIFFNATQKWAKEMCVDFSSVKITSAKTRWGSCSGKNDIRFTFRLLYAPKAVVDYVIVHELAHIKEKNHSKAFWSVVERYIPDYKERRKWLKLHGYLTQIF